VTREPAGVHAATLRLLAQRGRVVQSRTRVVAAAARARRGGPRAYTLWPDARRPMLSADMGYPPAAEWLRGTMVPTLRRLPDAATWMSLRAGAALVSDEEGLAERVGAGLTGARTRPRLALFSPSGQAVSKAVCFLFREGDSLPSVVVKAMAEPRFAWRLRAESELLARVRDRVAHDAWVAATLPPRPGFAGDNAGEFVLAEPFDPLGAATGSGGPGPAREWLRLFQAASCVQVRSWSDADERTALAAARAGWRLAERDAEAAVAVRLRALFAPLRGAELPRCAVHGDFWRGNVAAVAGSVRVYDWEWAALDGTPLVDLWTYELAELRILARDGERGLESHLVAALGRVRDELRLRRLDERFALATLAPVLGTLSFRIRSRLGMPDEMERHSVPLIAAAERLLLSDEPF